MHNHKSLLVGAMLAGVNAENVLYQIQVPKFDKYYPISVDKSGNAARQKRASLKRKRKQF